MKVQVYDVEIRGTRPMLMHNGQLADPMNEYTRELARLTRVSKGKKTDEDHIAIGRAEFQGSLYFHEECGPFIPCDMLQAVLEGGARARKLGKEVERFVSIVPPDDIDGYPLDYKGPRDRDGLYAADAFRFTKGAVVSGRRVMRTRPRFPAGWSVKFQVEVLDGTLTRDQLEQAMIDAGVREGLGDWRPRYGRFEVVSVS